MNHPSKGERRLTTPLRSRLREQVRSAILDSAEHELGAHGLHSARMEDIAERAGVSVGTLYNYFGDRERLIQELLAVRGGDLLLQLDSVLSEPEAGFSVRLGEFLRAMFQHFERHRRLFARVFDGEEAPSSGTPSPTRRELKRALFERLVRLVGVGVASGELDPDHAELYPALLMGLTRGAIVHSMLEAATSTSSVAERVQTCARVFLDGVRRR